jgi:hypothetical protein
LERHPVVSTTTSIAIAIAIAVAIVKTRTYICYSCFASSTLVFKKTREDFAKQLT